MSYLKVLQPPWHIPTVSENSFFKNKEDLFQHMKEQRYEEVELLFNRDGFYYDRHKKYAWYETWGKAYTKRGLEKDFLYELSLLDMKTLNDEVVKCIEILLSKYNIKNQELSRMLDEHNTIIRIKTITRNSRAYINKITKELKSENDTRL